MKHKIDIRSIASLAGWQTIIQYFLFYVGLAHASAVRSAILNGTQPFITIILAVVVFRYEKLTARKICGCLLGFAGVVLIETLGQPIELGFAWNGEGFILVSCIASSMASCLIKKYGQKSDPVLLSGYQFMLGGSILTMAAVAAGNDRAESSVAHDLAEPLFGRFAHIYIIRTTVENWMPWAVRKKINPYVMEFLASNDLYLRTVYMGTEGYADPRRWEMVSRILDSSDNDFSLIEPIVGRDTAEAFIRFFRAQDEMTDLAKYTDEEISHLTVARKYQIVQQCLYAAAAKPEEAEALVERLGAEFAAWFRYVLSRKK
jgi:hypothetical protein